MSNHGFSPAIARKKGTEKLTVPALKFETKSSLDALQKFRVAPFENFQSSNDAEEQKKALLTETARRRNTN